MKKRTALFIASALTLALLMTACGEPGGGGSQGATAPSASYGEGDFSAGEDFNNAYSPETSVPMDNGSQSATDVQGVTERKVVKNAAFELETKDFADTCRQLQERTEAAGGYVQSSSTSGDPELGGARMNLTVRIPSEQYEAFKQAVAGVGNVVSSSESGEDVTAQYFDTEARLNVLRAQETRVLQLLEQSGTLTEMLEIENELTRIRTEIEELTTVLKRLDTLTAYATVEISVWQAREYTSVPDDSFGSRLGEAFQDSWKFLLSLMQNFVIVLIWLWPYIIIALIIFLIIWFSLRHKRKKNPPKPAQPPQRPVPPANPGAFPPGGPPYQSGPPQPPQPR